jgi:hypothetical protein
MKKALLIGAVLLAGVSGNAQNNRQAGNHQNKSIAGRNNHLIESNTPSNSTTGTTRVNHNGVSAVCPAPVTNNGYSSGPNAFGVGGGVTTYKQNCLSYNKDLNCYVVTHRRSASWAASNPMGSGAIQSTWIDITSGVKDSSILYYEAAATNPARYPSGVIYNPAGNTNWANAWLVGSGPALVGNGTFNGSWHATRHLTGTAADQANPGTDLDYNLAGGGMFGSSMFVNYDMQQVGTKVLVAGELNDTTTITNTGFNKANGTVIGKCDFSTGSPVWSYDSIRPPFYFNRNGAGLGYASEFGEGGRLAFAPNGLTGYLVMFGLLDSTISKCNSADSMISPIVYKTTNGGTTWTLTNASKGYDWRKEHPELMQGVGALQAVQRLNWSMNYKNGTDVTVDANNKLHIATTLAAPFKDGASKDSIATYGDTYDYDYINHHPIYWDLMTDGTAWSTLLIDSAASAYMGSDPATDTTATTNPMGNAGTFLPFGSRLQISRTLDGSKIIYSWADSDPSATGSKFNIQPDIFMKAWDVNTMKMTPSTNVTNGLGVCFFHMFADISYMSGANLVAPFMYSIPRTLVGSVYTATGITDHFYSTCGSFAPTDFTGTAVTTAATGTGNYTGCVTGIKSNHNAFVSSVSNYPNPFNGTTNIVVNLNEGKSINVTVVDAIGKVVAVKTATGVVGNNTIVFDAANLNAGVYYYTVTAGYEKVTKKMVIQK